MRLFCDCFATDLDLFDEQTLVGRNEGGQILSDQAVDAVVLSVAQYFDETPTGIHGSRMIDVATGVLPNVSKNDEFCNKNKEICIKNKALCIKNKEFCITMMNSAV